MPDGYRPPEYWERRLAGRFSLSGVGHLGFSEEYNRWLYRAKRRALRRALSAHGIGLAGKTVCDVGCGTGFFVDFYAGGGARGVTGVDITDVSVARLSRRWPGCRFVRGDISSAEFAGALPGEFDIVNAWDVLYHIVDDEAFGRAVAHLCRLCRPGGWVLVSDLLSGADRDEAAHVRFRSRGRYADALAASGVEVRGIRPLYFLLNRPLLGARLDNALAPLYFVLDRALMSGTRSNLKLLVGKKGAR